ncbi:TPA: hypothetical protein ACG05V_002144 [Bacillus pacificus]|nr:MULTISPECIES: hypothetical protein [Bacillus cereus group]MCU5070266.1 hypothetical protein [Bacillus pacificus]MDA1573320.1 hypothetical protein [Bacillus cereus group sp. TH242-3LC]MED1584703.1 hypothetical protein [Bacillus pacificus]UTG86090.1 hypothetical protein MON12_13685 [Bacillus pacificus]
MMRRKGYFIINETKEMYNNEMIISDNILSNPSTLEELKEMVFNGEIEEVFISHYFDNQKSNLERKSLEDVRKDWDIEYHNNISLSDEPVSLEDFPNEYFFFVEMWGNENGNVILVLFMHH